MLTVGFIDEDWDPTSYAPTATSSYFMRLRIAESKASIRHFVRLCEDFCMEFREFFVYLQHHRITYQ